MMDPLKLRFIIKFFVKENDYKNEMDKILLVLKIA